MDVRAEFVNMNGEIGDIYQKDEWMLRFGFFCTGYSAGFDAALKIKVGQKPSTNSAMDAICLAHFWNKPCAWGCSHGLRRYTLF